MTSIWHEREVGGKPDAYPVNTDDSRKFMCCFIHPIELRGRYVSFLALTNGLQNIKTFLMQEILYDKHYSSH